jgi:hypothetical protein
VKKPCEQVSLLCCHYMKCEKLKMNRKEWDLTNELFNSLWEWKSWKKVDYSSSSSSRATLTSSLDSLTFFCVVWNPKKDLFKYLNLLCRWMENMCIICLIRENISFARNSSDADPYNSLFSYFYITFLDYKTRARLWIKPRYYFSPRSALPRYDVRLVPKLSS